MKLLQSAGGKMDAGIKMKLRDSIDVEPGV
jgi:hypothetical protein